MDNDFVIPLTKVDILRQNQARIVSLFPVDLQEISSGDRIAGNPDQQACWIRVTSRNGNTSPQQQQQDVQYAKEYILSLVSSVGRPLTEYYNQEQYEFLKKYHNQIEANGRGIVFFDDATSSIHIYGLSMNQVLTQSVICHLLENYCDSDRAPSINTGEEVRIKSRGDRTMCNFNNTPHSSQCMSPEGDSCYESSEDCPIDPPYPSPPIPNRSTKPQSLSHSPPSSTSSDPETEKIQMDSSYISKVEFGVKLGYSESDVLSCLQKLGINASQNQLLAELINLGSTKQDPKGTIEKSRSENQEQSEQSCRPGMEEAVTFPSTSQSDSFGEDSPLPTEDGDPIYRHIVIDGSNVAMSHGNKEVFSCEGIKLAVDWFRNRGCTDITVFVPQWRKETSRPDAPIKDQAILLELEREKILTFTPARRISGKRVVCYDDRYVLNHAVEEEGIIVSNDNYRDLLSENKEYKKAVEERLLMYSFARDKFMPPDDPLGRHGPSLENFLRKEPAKSEAIPPPCPYGKKCTYGNKCKYYHPERGNQPHKSVTEKLAEQAKHQMQEMKDRGKACEEKKKAKKHKEEKRLLTRTDSSTLSYGNSRLTPPLPPRKPTRELPEQPSSNECKAYNEKLSRLRKNIEAQQSSKVMAPLPKPPYVNIEQHPTIPDPWLVAPERNQVRNALGREQLVTGHLAVAQTLSDEANRENRQKHEAEVLKRQEELKEALRREPHHMLYSPQESSASQLSQKIDNQLTITGAGHSLNVQTSEVGLSLPPQHPPPPIQAPLYPQHSRPMLHNPNRENLYFARDGIDLARPPSSDHLGLQSPPSSDQLGLQSSPSSDHLGLPRPLSSDHLCVQRPPSSDHFGLQRPPSSDHFGLQRPPSADHFGLQRPHSPDHFGLQRLPSSDQLGLQGPPYSKSSYRPRGHSPLTRQNSSSDPALNVHMAPPRLLLDRPATQAQGNLPSPYFYPPAHNTPLDGKNWPQTQTYPNPPPGFPPEANIPPTDKRYSMYCYLCGIFPEPHVRVVMNSYPLESNPRVLVMHIMNMNG